MKSFNFPNMLKSASSDIISGKEATLSNLKLLLASEKGELFGDPYFGSLLKKRLFDQNDLILKDILIDEIYTQLRLFMPQLIIERKDINITQTRNSVNLIITAINNLDFTTDLYNLVLFEEDN